VFNRGDASASKSSRRRKEADLPFADSRDFASLRRRLRGLLKVSLVSIAALATATTALAAGRQLTGPFAPAPTPALAPADAQKKFTLLPGFEIRLFAAEPDVINPVAMTWDERGRLWVLELYEYPLGAPPGAKPRDRIKILEDTDNDGRADKVTIFADGLNLATGLLLGNGGVYVGQAPDFLFLQDTNHDDVADTRKVLLTGFGLDDRHELLNGFTWGPDGSLYMTHGVFTHSKVRIPEASAPGVEVTAAVARFQPRTKKFEVFAEGTSNPWGVDFDRHGNAFVSACVLDHLFHMAPGGIYARQGGVPANPYAYELLPSIVDHKHYMAAYCGVCIYQGTQFPEEYRGHVLMGNIHQNALNHDRLAQDGSSFKALAEKDFLTTPDEWFRPVSVQVGPEGALWVADWYDKYPCYQNAQADPEGVDRQYGRIWRVVYTGKNAGAKVASRPDPKMDLAELDNSALVKLLEHPNVWQRRMAQRILAERPDRAIGPALKALVAGGKSIETRLAGFWTLHACDLLDEEMLSNLAGDKDPVIRMWVARFTGERQLVSEASLARLQTLAEDSDPAVRLATATAIRQFVSGSLTVDTPAPVERPEVSRVLITLITSSSNAKDPLIPFMIWMAGEPGFAKNPQPALDWLAQNGSATMPLSGILVRKAMRRICDTQDAEKLDLAVDFLTRTASAGGLAVAAIDGLLEGQRAKPMPPTTDTKILFDLLGRSENRLVKERGQELGTIWGNAASIQATLGAINDSSLSLSQRVTAVGAAKTLKNQAARNALLQLIGGSAPEPLVNEGIRALGEVGGDAIAEDLVKAWVAFSPGSRAAAAEVLAARRPWAIALLSAIETKRMSASDLPLTVVRALGQSKDDFIRQRALQAIGRIRPADADKQQIIEAKKKLILAAGQVDPGSGHELMKKTCLVCHKFYGEGAEVGPDLTGVGRSTLDALLANVIDPNQVIGKGYENVEIETKDGRSVSGRMVENTDTRVKLLASGPKEEVIAKSDIASMRVSELSVMPEGLEQMPDNDFRNLILYVLHPPQEQGAAGTPK
jgi:putative membrane-bound dehydrogenase-like protein